MARFSAVIGLGTAIALAFSGAPAAAAATPHGPSLVVDAESGAVLQADQPDQPWFPASLAKVMTAYLVFETMAKGHLAGDTRLPVSKAAAGQAPVRVGLRAGRKIALSSALNAAVVASANDAAVVLAEAVAGSETSFALLMTAKARQLGMDRTVFANATGLPHPDSRTTARDMALLARALLRDFPEQAALFGQPRARFGQRQVRSTNGWLTAFEGARGLKTGFTCDSGYNLIGMAERNGRLLLGIVLGEPTSGRRNARMSKLLAQAFKTTAEGKPLLNDLAPEPAQIALVQPPRVLGPGTCAKSSRSATLGNGRLPGWGVILGAYHSRAEAKAVIARQRKAGGGALKKGRPAVVTRAQDGSRRFNALLVGLKQADAGQACKALWARGAYCLALPPDQLNNPKAIWR